MVGRAVEGQSSPCGQEVQAMQTSAQATPELESLYHLLLQTAGNRKEGRLDGMGSKNRTCCILFVSSQDKT